MLRQLLICVFFGLIFGNINGNEFEYKEVEINGSYSESDYSNKTDAINVYNENFLYRLKMLRNHIVRLQSEIDICYHEFDMKAKEFDLEYNLRLTEIFNERIMREDEILVYERPHSEYVNMIHEMENRFNLLKEEKNEMERENRNLSIDKCYPIQMELSDIEKEMNDLMEERASFILSFDSVRVE